MPFALRPAVRLVTSHTTRRKPGPASPAPESCEAAPRPPRWSVLVLLLCMTGSIGTTFAEGSVDAGTSTNRLTLCSAQQLAFLRNWDLLAAQRDVDIATAGRLVAREFPNPTLSASVGKISLDAAHPNTGHGFGGRDYDTIAAVTQLIEIGGKRRARKDAAEAGVRAAGARLADARRRLDEGVAQAYVAALLAERSRQVLVESAASLQTEARLAATREQAGDISSADRSQIEIAAQRLELEAAEAATTARNARLNLAVLLGDAHPTGEWQLADELEPLAEASVPSHEATAPEDRPDMVAADAEQSRAEAELRQERAQRVPDPTFLAQYEHEPPDQPHTLGVGVSLPLPLWNHNRGRIAAAEANLDQARLATQKVRAAAEAEVAMARDTYASAHARWRHYRDELAPRSRQVRESVAYAYEHGGSSLLDLLSAQRNDNEIRLATVQAAADAANAAATLKAALTHNRTPESKP